jgi:hypothetical protein
VASSRTHFSTRLGQALQLPSHLRTQNKEAVEKLWALAAGTMMLINSESIGKRMEVEEVSSLECI